MLPVPYSKVLIPISINTSWMASPVPEAIASGGIGMCTRVKGNLFKRRCLDVICLELVPTSDVLNIFIFVLLTIIDYWKGKCPIKKNEKRKKKREEKPKQE